MSRYEQGGSSRATPEKQAGLHGIFHMQTLRWKDRQPLIFVDLYAGSGRNVIDGVSINGSPLSLLSGVARAIASSKTTPPFPWVIVFNDIAPGRATDILPDNVMRWQEENGFPVDSEHLTVATQTGNKVKVPIKYLCSPSSDVVHEIKRILGSGMNGHFLIAVDPNGPKDAPWDDLVEVWDRHSSKVEFVFHIAATHLKRVAKAKAATGFTFAPIPDHISAMFAAFGKCGGWIREPVGPDQWTLALISKFPPKQGWNTKSASFHRIDSEAGQATIKRLTSTKKELNNERDSGNQQNAA